MNIFVSQENVFLLGRIVAMAIVLSMFLYAIRHGLRVAHEQFMKLGRFTKCAVICFVFGSTGYGGYKNWCTTNPPPDQTSSPTNMAVVGMPGGHALPSLQTMVMQPPPSTSTFNLITNWTARGAWCDWKRIEFGDSFSFPCGTNLLTGVTLMSYGELRPSLHGPVVANVFATSNQLPTTSYQLPALSLEPDASSVAYGLTPSNSFVFVWENACVNRDATNRINAAIELFQNGDMCVSTLTTNNQQLTTLFVPCTPPEEFHGSGQNEDWSTNTFAFAADEIAEKGYQGWLDDYVGINEPNGRYKLAVTIAALPEHGPCYLVCGPYRMVVTQPGTYSFPLMDMTEYELYTCPVAVPLTYEFDDGWDPIEPDNSPYMMLSSPRMALGAPRNNRYRVERFPEVYLRPNYLTREQALQELIEIRCNAAGIAARDYTSISGRAHLIFVSHTEAQIEEAEVQDEIYFNYEYNGRSVGATLYIRPNWWWPWWYDPDSTNDTSNVSSTNGNGSATAP